MFRLRRDLRIIRIIVEEQNSIKWLMAHIGNTQVEHERTKSKTNIRLRHRKTVFVQDRHLRE